MIERAASASDVSSRPKMRWIHPATLLPLLESIEELPADSTGAFILGEQRQAGGLVLVQDGRVCWAVCHHMRGRLTDLLIEESGDRALRSEMDALYESCRETGAPLGETLVRLGIVSSAGLRSALFRHSCEALIACAPVRSRQWTWRTHTVPSYDAAFCFTPAELYVGLAAVQCPEQASRARAELEARAPDGACALAFIRAPGLAPIVARDCSLSVRELAEVASFCTSVLDVSAALAPCSYVLLRAASGSALFTWQSQQLAYLVACAERSDLTFVIAKRTR